MSSYLVRRGNSEDGALKVIQESIDDLEKQFEPWQRRVEGWDRAVFPETQGHVARDLGSYFMQGLKPETLQRSRYVTAWCRSSLEALVNRLFSYDSKNHLLVFRSRDFIITPETMLAIVADIVGDEIFTGHIGGLAGGT